MERRTDRRRQSVLLPLTLGDERAWSDNRSLAEWSFTDWSFTDGILANADHRLRRRRLPDRQIGRHGGTRNPEDRGCDDYERLH
jgi:hypothetical protein